MMMFKLPREQRQQLVDQVKRYFEQERDEVIGDLAAEQWINYMLELLGPHIYNEALSDTQKLLSERHAALEDELYAMQKSVPRSP
ncbi:DUF2164 domain-containing protein [Paenibacillus sp. 481]|uniref:DUF2164 domain-containing protein n=1 Tax=Paenibacillus sp. 481 TaxID=2835869 RepID=UPI001E60DD55|nr:DUF2164 domain-containing protein [Paenibacillus sp. 481]UHA72774.1 DUF2164 domain-containing protein [Paenibacillus sp. 481]